MCSGVIVMISIITTWPVDERDHRDRDVRPRAGSRRADVAVAASPALRSPSDLSASSYGSGRRSDERQDRRAADEHASAARYGAGQRRQPDRHAKVAGRADEIRPDDGTEGRAPHDHADRRGPSRGGYRSAAVYRESWFERIAEADQHRPDEQQRERPRR